MELFFIVLGQALGLGMNIRQIGTASLLLKIGIREGVITQPCVNHGIGRTLATFMTLCCPGLCGFVIDNLRRR